MNAAVGALLFAIALLGAVTCRAEEPNSEWVKQVLRLQVSEFCATVKPPPKALVEGVQAAAQAGNTDAQIAFMWLVRIMERYEKNRCGDA